MPSDLDNLRRIAANGMIALLWFHVPFNLLIAVMLGNDWLLPGIFAVVLAGAATLAWFGSPTAPATRMTIAVAVIGIISLLVYQMHGQPWQIDTHMYYFAGLALLTAFCDWQVMLIAAGATAVQHLVLNFAYPAAIYPGGADLGRVVLHAVIVVLETTVLVWLTHRLARLFAVNDAAIAEANEAREKGHGSTRRPTRNVNNRPVLGQPCWRPAARSRPIWMRRARWWRVGRTRSAGRSVSC